MRLVGTIGLQVIFFSSQAGAVAGGGREAPAADLLVDDVVQMFERGVSSALR